MRTKIGKFYVERNRIGQIKKWVSVKKSLGKDVRQRALTKVKPRYGNRGDQ